MISSIVHLASSFVSLARHRPRNQYGALRRQHRSIGKNAWWLTICCLIGLHLTAPRAAIADELTFHIPGQSLASALETYSHVSGVQVLYESSSAEGRRSVEVDGTYTPDVALRVLLADTDLIIRYTRADAITLAPASARNSDEPPSDNLRTADLVLETLHLQAAADRGDLSRLRDYSRIIENDIQKALKRNPRTRVGNYSVGIRLWIDQSRTIKRAELFRSSGDQARDAAIASALDGLVISQASPTNTPQPVSLMISVNSLL